MSDSVLSFIGDVWLPQRAYDFSGLLGHGVVVLNLEGAITSSGSLTPGKICLASDHAVARSMFLHTNMVANLANNHTLDFGREGIENTLSALTTAGVRYFGAGKAEDNYNNPLVLHVGGHSVALLGYACASTHPGEATECGFNVAPLDLELIAKDVASAKEQGVDRVVVSLHWGDEQVSRPKPSDVQIARKLSGLAIDMIVGHHAHCVQPMTTFESTPIYFGLGNAVFPDFDVELSNGRRAWARQRIWNRRSLIVGFDVISGRTSAEGLLQSGTELVRVSKCKHVRVKSLTRSEARGRTWRFNLYRRFSVLRQVTSRFVARPKLPSARAFQSVFSMIKNGP